MPENIYQAYLKQFVLNSIFAVHTFLLVFTQTLLKDCIELIFCALVVDVQTLSLNHFRHVCKNVYIKYIQNMIESR